MKKVIALLLACVLAFAMVACGGGEKPDVKGEGVMTYAEYAAAALDTEVTIEAYVQAKQGWWEKDGVGVATIYTQDKEGAYFIYEMPISQDDYNKLTAGTKIKVKGFKGEWAGEVEIMDATYEILDGNWVATATEANAWLGTDELIKHQNEVVLFKGMTVEAISYKNGEPGDDIYLTLGYEGASYDFCVEVYLTGPDSEVYQTVGTLAEGDVVDIQGFLYWYEGPNPHVTNVTLAG